jgi:hypothetical protein
MCEILTFVLAIQIQRDCEIKEFEKPITYF